jgi:hypothetical protein
MAVASKQKPLKKARTPKEAQLLIQKNRPCMMCGEKGEYYISKSVMYKKFGQLPWCKSCILELYNDAYRRFQDNERAIIDVCKMTNLPFFRDCFESAKSRLEKEGLEIISGYFFAMALARGNKNATFMDSDLFQYSADGILHLRSKIAGSEDSKQETELATTSEIIENVQEEGTDEDLFGFGFTPDEYRAMRKKYNFLKINYVETTNMHTESILTYIKYRVKEEFAIASGNHKEAKEWGDRADKAASNAKINPSQLTKADLMGGANSFGEIVQAVEQATDVIHILPKFKYQPNDALDFLQWSMIDYLRHLEGTPSCSYADIFAFYDKRKSEYIKTTGDPYGIFKGDTTESNRPAIIDFISDSDKEEIIEPEYIEDDDNEQ